MLYFGFEIRAYGSFDDICKKCDFSRRRICGYYLRCISLARRNILGICVLSSTGVTAPRAYGGRCRMDTNGEARRCIALRHEMLHTDGPAKLRLNGKLRT